jgi:hypothetical protein
MLSDRYVLYKEASEVVASTGLQAAKNHLNVIWPALAIGGGLALVKHVMRTQNDAKLRAEADRVFEAIRQRNQTIRDEPELAFEAFRTLRDIAPSVAARPLVAETFIENTVRAKGQLNIDTAHALARAEKDLQEGYSRGDFFEEAGKPMKALGFKWGKSSHD